MGKKPYLELYINDFRADTLGLSATSTGIWIRALCDMAWQNDYKMSGTLDELCRICGCTLVEWADFMAANSRRNVAPVTQTAEIVTVISRRRLKEHKEREQARLRKARQREEQDCPEKVTNALSSSSSSSSSKKDKRATDAALVLEFENDFWPQVRKKETKADTLRLFVSLRKKGAPLATLLSGLKEYQRAKADDDIKYLMQPKKFLGPGRHWEEWAEKATVAEAEIQRAKEANERREKTVLKRTVQPTNPNPDMAKQLRELAKDLGEGKAIPGEAEA